MTTEFERALSQLDGLKKVGNGYIARCPCHHDIHQSLSISEGENGKALIFCHAGCRYEDIIARLNLKFNRPDIKPVIDQVYSYTDENGKLLYQVVRYKPKDFRQRRPDGNGGWIWNLNGIEPTLYHLPEVLQAVKDNQLIFAVEGERDVETLREHGLIATTISGGSSTSWTPRIISHLRHARLVLIPDNDTAGKQYAEQIARILYGWCDSLKMIHLPVAVKGDVSDYLKDHTINDLMQIVKNTPEYTPIGAVTRDEFNSLKGHIIYLQGKLNESCRKRRRSKYD